MKVGIYHTDGREFHGSSDKFTRHLKTLPKEEVLECKKGDIVTYRDGLYTLNGIKYNVRHVKARDGVKMAVFTKYINETEFEREIRFF